MDPTPRATALRTTVSPERGGIMGAAIIGLFPLILVAALGGMSILAATVARLLAAPQGFFVQQQLALVVLATGLGLSMVAFAAAAVRALRRVRQWQLAGDFNRAAVTQLALVVSELVVALPVAVALALTLPQHPAP